VNIAPYILKFSAIYKPKLWGGSKIKTSFSRHIEDEKIGESWEISGIENNETPIKNGIIAGKTLKEAIKIFKERLVGKTVYEEFGCQFPILVKFIDAQTPLSIQVHPDNYFAKKNYNSLGKNEMWFIIGAEPTSEILVGFNQNLNEQKIRKALETNSIENFINKYKVNPGEAYFIEAGTIHGIGKGVFLLEIQQASDITHRIFDYNRIDNATGRKRELNIEASMNVLDMNAHLKGKQDYYKIPNVHNKLIYTRYFKTNLWLITQNINRDLSGVESFVIYICISGEVDIKSNCNSIILLAGESAMIPAEFKNIVLSPMRESELIEVYIEA